MKHLLATFSLLAPLTLCAPAAVVIDWATVGNAGNAADPATGSLYGAVAYTYNIARNETTIAQYWEFLNAKAASDPHGLYSAFMASDDNIAGISRDGIDGSYTYSVLNSGDRPITHVSWFDAARFVNWMHNGQGSGSTETGVYALNGATSGIFTAQAGASVWLPTEDEWYKAAYYDPTKGGTGGYWLHANQSDSMPSNDFSDPGAANYLDRDYATTPGNNIYSSSQNYLTDVGVYGLDSQSYYGTNDQAGNVLEWNDAVIPNSNRGMRGGAWNSDEEGLRSSFRGVTDPADQFGGLGFRLASVPEPSAFVLTILFGAGCLCRRKR